MKNAARVYRRTLNTTEFAYWLQGALEIPAIQTISALQTEIILKRMQDIDNFPETLRALLGDITIEQLKNRSLTIEQATGLQARKAKIDKIMAYPIQIWLVLMLTPMPDALQTIIQIQTDIFVHEIDPTYDGDQEYFHAVHRGEIEPE